MQENVLLQYRREFQATSTIEANARTQPWFRTKYQDQNKTDWRRKTAPLHTHSHTQTQNDTLLHFRFRFSPAVQRNKNTHGTKSIHWETVLTKWEKKLLGNIKNTCFLARQHAILKAPSGRNDRKRLPSNEHERKIKEVQQIFPEGNIIRTGKNKSVHQSTKHFFWREKSKPDSVKHVLSPAYLICMRPSAAVPMLALAGENWGGKKTNESLCLELAPCMYRLLFGTGYKGKKF